MTLLSIGYGSAEATTVTIPADHQAGDFLIIYAFRGALTAPSLPAGWTNFNTASTGASSYRCGFKVATSNAETSGTWTNATGLMVGVYRNQATNKTAISQISSNTNTNVTINYNGAAGNMKCPGTSWVVAFGVTKTIDSTIETAPTNLTNKIDLIGAATEYACHDSNGIYTQKGNWPLTNVSVGGTSAEWRTFVIEIMAEQLNLNNFKFSKDYDTGDAGVLAFTEKIR